MRELEKCLACHNHLKLWADPLVLDLGLQPSANLLLNATTDPYKLYPLRLNTCHACGHCQLSHAVDRKELFGSGYPYASSTGNALQPYFSWFAKHLSEMLHKEARVLEIGCNDGSLLRNLRNYGLDVHGVEPDAALAAVAASQVGADRITNGFWPDVAYDDSIPDLNERPFNCIVAMNVIAHVPDPTKFLDHMLYTLHPGGFIILQTSQANMLSAGQFDAIYAEHISYFSMSSMRALAAYSNLCVADCLDVNIHGRSRIWVVARDDGYREYFSRMTWNYLHHHDDAGEFALSGPTVDHSSPDATWRFRLAAKKKAVETALLAEDAKSAGRPVVLLGAAAKAITMMRFCGIEPDLVLDEGEAKIGRYIPGWRSPIQPLSALRKVADPLILAGAWNVPGLPEKAATAAGRSLDIHFYFPKTYSCTVRPC